MKAGGKGFWAQEPETEAFCPSLANEKRAMADRVAGAFDSVVEGTLRGHRASSWFEVLQTTDRSQTAVMTLKPGASTGDHPESHEKSQQVLLLIEGEMLAQLDQETQRLKAGDVVVIPPGVKHKFTNQGETPAVTFNVYCPPEYLPDEKG